MRSGPFDAGATSGARATGYTCGNVGWYRRHFSAADTSRRKHTIVFEGVYQNSDVYVNGHHLGFHPYGCERSRAPVHETTCQLTLFVALVQTRASSTTFPPST